MTSDVEAMLRVVLVDGELVVTLQNREETGDLGEEAADRFQQMVTEMVGLVADHIEKEQAEKNALYEKDDES